MAERKDSTKRIMKILLKDFSIKHTVTSLAEETGMSRVGIWKLIKKLDSEKLVLFLQIGSGKTSVYSISLNWDNLLTEKNLEIYLTEEALKNQRWMDNFAEIGKNVDFFIIYGSILNSPKEANDIDILSVADSKKFTKIDEILLRMQKAQIKKIHCINLTEQELKKEIMKPNKTFVDAMKTGIILFGQENFIKFIKRRNRYDEFLHKIQQAKMRELWDNKEDEAWENA